MRFILFALMLCTKAFGTKYYYATGGTGNALSMAAPGNYADLRAKAIAATDSIYLKRGDIFTGGVWRFSGSGTSGQHIYVGAWGSGAKPVITGLTTISSWSDLGGGIYSKVLTPNPSTRLNVLLIDGVLKPVARLPKDGQGDASWYNIDDTANINNSRWTNGNGTIFSSSLTGDLPLVGSEIAHKTFQWIIDRAIVTSYTPGQISYASMVAPDHPTASYPPFKNHGFFFQNGSFCLTEYGDWWHDRTNATLQMHFGAVNPTTKTIQVSTIDTLLSLNNRSYITIEDIDFNGVNEHAINLHYSKYININRCDFKNVGINAINVNRPEWYECYNITVENSTFKNSLNNALNANQSFNWIVRDNIVDSLALVPGGGPSGDGQYVAMYKLGTGSLAEYNKISNVGYSGIWFDGSNTTVRFNEIFNYSLIKSDGGGIYTYGNGGTNRLVERNIIYNGFGNRSGIFDENDNPYSVRVHGIYNDSHSQYVTMKDNTCFENGFCGIWYGSSKHMLATGNTLYNNRAAQLTGNDNEGTLIDITSNDNIMFAKDSGALAMALNVAGISNMTFKRNLYMRPIWEPAGINGIVGYNIIPFTWGNYNGGGVIEASGEKFYSLERWQALRSKDSGAYKSPVRITNANQIRFEYNATKNPVSIDLGSTVYVDPYGSFVIKTLVLQPYTSRILLQTNGAVVWPVKNERYSLRRRIRVN